MSQVITAIYEDGVLRPLMPLELPEHAEVQLKLELVLEHPDEQAGRRKVDRALMAAGLMLPRSTDHPTPPLTDAERDALARRIPAGHALSEIILEERDGR
ncbi:MAG TPA: antitoxin family protein [Chloroflexota bacterium]|nr:antitoxin family protein [Chloroflexota bacterium]